MLHIAIISLAIGNLALLYGFMWMNRRIRSLEVFQTTLTTFFKQQAELQRGNLDVDVD